MQKSHRRIVTFAFSIGIAIVAACSVNVNVADKGCPCLDGLLCDTVNNRCVTVLPAQPNPDGSTAPPPAACTDANCKCNIDGDCADPKRRFCGPQKTCVECLQTPTDTCTAGGYCNERSQCTVGCKAEGDCPAPQRCQTTTHRCVECTDDPQCGGGTKKCSPSGKCVDGCTVTNGSVCGTAGGTCCDGFCISLTDDVLNCGQCGRACSTVNNSPLCEAGNCTLRCADGFDHCQAPGENTGCETNIRTVNNCGSCTFACTSATVVFADTIACAGTACTYGACQVGHIDDNDNTNDGCESTCGTAFNAPCCPGNVCTPPLNCKTTGKAKCQ